MKKQDINKVTQMLGLDLITNENTLTRRLYRAWIDGSYLGEDHYHRNMNRIREADTFKKLRSFVIESFTGFIAHENAVSYSYAQKCIVDYYNNLDEKFAEDWRNDHLQALTFLLMEELEETYADLFPDDQRLAVSI